MSSISCRYCPFYAPSIHTPVFGDCAGVFPPERVPAINPDCPYHGDRDEIERQALARGFLFNDLRRLEYFGISIEDGLRSPFYPTLDRLKEYVEAQGSPYVLYVRYIDFNGHPFARAVIPDERS